MKENTIVNHLHIFWLKSINKGVATTLKSGWSLKLAKI